ncbi:carboxypeptidase regulatory-like domain-containing protein [Actinoplanes sp. LDG1-06]|uniref:Carboxypeptidase regulatory-like domain-containing protein n=1 Tax=Paractinoplanes ovalisporus TaxID=2810368 RepID=A0ABS2A8X3_9ACTN|nr:carboxypeptidase regulatory-like domain-containing protein [Actinoplanes ovalisporus]MBM2616272.1 carboxypeptidase regulatory-like domain-containing protein [Actinoplanes ovalisporus]
MSDPVDAEILERIARWDRPPPDLDERVLFAIELDQVDAEVARLTETAYAGSGARAAERTRTITFEADSRTVMITVVERPDNLVRIDGWLAPGAALRVELRLPEPAASRTVTADRAGRFVFDEVPHGLAQLLVEAQNGGGRVVTPSLVL